MLLNKLYLAIADVLDGDLEIERAGAVALTDAANMGDIHSSGSTPLADDYLKIFAEVDAHPLCSMIAEAELNWAPPTISDDPKYVADSLAKAHVDLIGPEGIVPSASIRVGLYGMQSGHEYGIRTHLAEEIFVMLAGEADWLRGESGYATLRAGARAYHPSMLKHANRTRDHAFMSIYIWHGDVSADSYEYAGNS